MSNLSKDDILKALECCTPENESCLNCPLIDVSVPECAGILYKATIDLINSQQSEVKEWKRVVETWQELHEKDKAEIEGLKTNREHSKLIIQRLKKKILVAKSEAIKEFAERLEEKIFNCELVYVYEHIDNIVKEMVGEQG